MGDIHHYWYLNEIGVSHSLSDLSFAIGVRDCSEKNPMKYDFDSFVQPAPIFYKVNNTRFRLSIPDLK